MILPRFSRGTNWLSHGKPWRWKVPRVAAGNAYCSHDGQWMTQFTVSAIERGLASPPGRCPGLLCDWPFGPKFRKPSGDLAGSQGCINLSSLGEAKFDPVKHQGGRGGRPKGG